MCDRCLACQGKGAPKEMHYKNFSSTKAWDLTTIYHEGYLELDKSNLTPWLCLPGFTVWSMSWDLLHNVFLGTGRDLVASGIRALVMQGCYDSLGLDGIDSILSHIDSKVRQSCKSFKSLVIPSIFSQRGIEQKNTHCLILVFFHLVTCVRLPFPAKPEISLHNLNGEDDYSELSSRFKGSAVKTLVWWLARETQTYADTMPEDALTFALVSCTN